MSFSSSERNGEDWGGGAMTLLGAHFDQAQVPIIG